MVRIKRLGLGFGGKEWKENRKKKKKKKGVMYEETDGGRGRKKRDKQ